MTRPAQQHYDRNQWFVKDGLLITNALQALMNEILKFFLIGGCLMKETACVSHGGSC